MKRPKSPAVQPLPSHTGEPATLISDVEPRRDITPATEALESSLQFRWLDGAATQVTPGYRTTVRINPYAAVACARNTTVRFWVENQPERLVEGEFALFVRPNLAYECVATDPGVSLWAHFTCTVLGTHDVFSLFQIPDVFHGAIAREMGEICQKLARNTAPADSHPLITACERQEYGLRLVRLLLRAGRPVAYHNLFHDIERISPVLQHVEANLSSDLTRESLAARVNLSPTRFHTIFKAVTGEAPMVYVRRLRLKHASELLLSSPVSVGEIAQRVGYCDQFHFSHEFKRLFRVSPLQYRQGRDDSIPPERRLP